jgi:3D (Asp-Asp-Asp) domain-containing protein
MIFKYNKDQLRFGKVNNIKIVGYLFVLMILVSPIFWAYEFFIEKKLFREDIYAVTTEQICLVQEVNIDIAKEFKKVVTLTTYTIESSQTDDEPLITASGFKLDSINPSKHRVIAISRDLKKTLMFGDSVRLTNAGRFDGVWYVRDLMNKRFNNKIDILINPDEKHTKLYGIVLTKLD